MPPVSVLISGSAQHWRVDEIDLDRRIFPACAVAMNCFADNTVLCFSNTAAKNSTRVNDHRTIRAY